MSWDYEGRVIDHAARLAGELEGMKDAFKLAAASAERRGERVKRLETEVGRLADKLEGMIERNKTGPEFGWTHEDEPADEMRRHAGFIVDDLRAALKGGVSRD